MSGFTHLDEQGRARMVDVTGKQVTLRRATARCVIHTKADVDRVLSADGNLALRAAELAAVQAAKRTADLIPLCHPLPLDSASVTVRGGRGAIVIEVQTQVVAQTGVEMEALAACTGAGLSLLTDLLPEDPEATLDELAVWQKSGGRSGDWSRHLPFSALSREAPRP